jgi:hypothetical protein
MKGSRFAAVAATVLVVGVLIAWLAPASLAQTQIQVLDHEGPYEKTIDIGKPGFSPGDTILGTHPLFDAADPSTVVGRDFERIQVLRIVAGGEDFDFVYDTTIRLDDGDIVAYGEGRISSVFAPGGASVPVTGGTGAYAGAAGVLSIAATETEGEFLITIDLIG